MNYTADGLEYDPVYEGAGPVDPDTDWYAEWKAGRL